MVDVERIYEPLPIGQDQVDVASMQQELERISASFTALVNYEPLAVLQGSPDSFTLDGASKALVNYGGAAQSSGWAGSINDSLGEITIGSTGLYRVNVHVAGDQGNADFNEAAMLDLYIGGVALTLATYEIPNNKTSRRTWNASLLLDVTSAPTVLRLELFATDGLGTFTFARSSFEVSGLNLSI